MAYEVNCCFKCNSIGLVCPYCAGPFSTGINAVCLDCEAPADLMVAIECTECNT